MIEVTGGGGAWSSCDLPRSSRNPFESWVRHTCRYLISPPSGLCPKQGILSDPAIFFLSSSPAAGPRLAVPQ